MYLDIHIIVFTLCQSYDDLISGERTTQQEIKSLEKKFDSWSQLPAPTTAAVTNKKAANSSVPTSMPPAVAAFEVKSNSK